MTGFNWLSVEQGLNLEEAKPCFSPETSSSSLNPPRPLADEEDAVKPCSNRYRDDLPNTDGSLEALGH